MESVEVLATHDGAHVLRMRQVRAQGRNVDSEVEQLRRVIARLEAEKTALAERVEEEGAERVTVVSSISHERDFLIRQVLQIHCGGRAESVLYISSSYARITLAVDAPDRDLMKGCNCVPRNGVCIWPSNRLSILSCVRQHSCKNEGWGAKSDGRETAKSSITDILIPLRTCRTPKPVKSFECP